MKAFYISAKLVRLIGWLWPVRSQIKTPKSFSFAISNRLKRGLWDALSCIFLNWPQKAIYDTKMKWSMAKGIKSYSNKTTDCPVKVYLIGKNKTKYQQKPAIWLSLVDEKQK